MAYQEGKIKATRNGQTRYFQPHHFETAKGYGWHKATDAPIAAEQLAANKPVNLKKEQSTQNSGEIGQSIEFTKMRSNDLIEKYRSLSAEDRVKFLDGDDRKFVAEIIKDLEDGQAEE